MQGVTLISYMKGNTGRACTWWKSYQRQPHSIMWSKREKKSVGVNEECVAQMENATRTFFGVTQR